MEQIQITKGEYTKDLEKGDCYLERTGVNINFYRTIVVPHLLKIRGYKCELCGVKNKLLDVHHEDYMEQNINTLKVLCRKCHMGIHRGLI